MRFLIDEDLPRATGKLLQNYGYDSIDIPDTNLRGAKDSQIASFAKEQYLSIITGDFDFSDIRNYPPSEYFGLVVLSVPKHSTAAYILNLIEEFLNMTN